MTSQYLHEILTSEIPYILQYLLPFAFGLLIGVKGAVHVYERP